MYWYLAVLKKYAVFSGRARRREYWVFVLFNCIIGVVVPFIIWFIPDTSVATFIGVLWLIYALGIVIPSFAVFVRRLHDTGRTGWWILIGLVPLIGAFVLLVVLVRDSQPGENQYGPNPKVATA